ncbi:carbohydrate ABC transporter permease [Alkaliphilus peptidifermentans]|uniref:Carbohydrate ABC transporter membrane protein 1, CUT1 family n=1 Tax=Alkaliphilus peptidifermentans DSM 18978 TaxID=1120976 RepID=A0A1G5J3V0_9FIRM|nr:sugar ABC transporter permease [Alkaliphilus peptidifermentans]SCY82620.1 carbohydrate ABC transporter membrane protein 1, CUT1 family [Alkaliphilus peptidifermentans DSM 18978]
MKQSKLWFTLFIAPILFAFIVVVIVPMIVGIYYSFTDWDAIRTGSWVGFDNYARVFKDKDFFNSFVFTTKFAIISVISINIIGFILALLVTQDHKISNFLRSVFFLPNLIGGLILGFIWQFIFTRGFDAVGKLMGIEFLQGWLSDTTTGFWGLVILMSWQMSGYMMVIYIAALQNIPQSLLEAADIDGANSWHKLKHITIPLVAPAFTVGVFLALSCSFKLYDQNLALTGGGPYNSTQMLALNIYNTAFRFRDFGGAQAKAVIFLLIVAAITLTQVYIGKKREVEM